MRTLLVEHADGRKERVRLSDALVVGRGDDCGLKLDDDGASRRHLKVELDGEGQVWVEDLASVNGSFLEGQRLSARTMLPPGALVTIGSARLSLATDGRSAKPSRPRAAWLLLLTVLGALVWVGIRFRSAGTPAPATGPLPGVTRNPGWELEQATKWCRSYSGVASAGGEPSALAGMEPDWARAQTACERARVLGPASPEVLALVRLVEREKEASDLYDKGERALERLRDEEALELFGQIDPESQYYSRARQRALEAAEGVKGRAEEDCRKLSREKQWIEAAKRCTTFLNVVCQTLPPEEVQKRPQLELLHKARREAVRVGPLLPDWSCPNLEVLKEASEMAAGLAGAQAAFVARYPDPEIAAALARYWSGHASEAISRLTRFSTSPDAPPSAQGLARRLLDQLSSIEGQLKAGQSQIASNDLDAAAGAFRDALKTDSEVMGDEGEKNPSEYRRSMEESIGVAAYSAGNLWASRSDWVRACRFWKLGFGFTRAHLDLNRALVNNCSGRAADLLRTAHTCRQLDEILEYATEGDGVQESVQDKRAQLRCP